MMNDTRPHAAAVGRSIRRNPADRPELDGMASGASGEGCSRLRGVWARARLCSGCRGARPVRSPLRPNLPHRSWPRMCPRPLCSGLVTVCPFSAYPSEAATRPRVKGGGSCWSCCVAHTAPLAGGRPPATTRQVHAPSSSEWTLRLAHGVNGSSPRKGWMARLEPAAPTAGRQRSWSSACPGLCGSGVTLVVVPG